MEAGFGRDDLYEILRGAAAEFGLSLPIVAFEPARAPGPGLTVGTLATRRQHADVVTVDLTTSPDLSLDAVKDVLSVLSREGLLCLTGVHHDMPPEHLRQRFAPVLEGDDWTLYSRRDADRHARSTRYRLDLIRRQLSYREVCDGARRGGDKEPLVAVVVLAYEHEAYIRECLTSVLSQAGSFRLRVIFIDDASCDGTVAAAKQAFESAERDTATFEVYVNDSNRGVVGNLARAVRLARGCDYLTFCEGDDFWSTDSRIDDHIAFLAERPECVMSFNTIEFCDADGTGRRIYSEHELDTRDTIDGHALSAFNSIGNFSACFYRGAVADVVPDELFSLYAVDWFFNLYCSQLGLIGHLQRPMTVYRQHDGGEWSALTSLAKAERLWHLIGEYDAFLDYRYTEGFRAHRRLLLPTLQQRSEETGERPFDVVILDDVFPSRRSGFRLAEFTAYLHEFPSALVLTSGYSLHVLGQETLHEAMVHLGRNDPHAGARVLISDGDFPLRLGRLLFVDFLNNALALLPAAESAGVPFAFTLYPGGGFVLHDTECDRKLQQVFSSPYFRRVVVTQQVTYDYIVDRGFCPPEAVELVFGVVMPRGALQATHDHGPRWGFGKPTLDLCFMAHRYTPTGEDKGYDVFLEVARGLAGRHDDVRFHVVGPYDESILPVDDLAGVLTFSGTLDPEEFDSFFAGMDAILSPNRSGCLLQGSFDGFPPACCTEAALRGVAVAAVDEFESARGHFTDGVDMIISPLDAGRIIARLEDYYADPEALRAIGRRGRARAIELYGAEAQIAPRLALLRSLLESPLSLVPQPGASSSPAEDAALGELLVARPNPRSPRSEDPGHHRETALEAELAKQTDRAQLLHKQFVAAHAELVQLQTTLARVQSRWPRRIARGLRHPRAAWARALARAGRTTGRRPSR